MKLFIVLDGVADRPCIALENKTPLEAAKTPNLDFLTKNSKLGYCYVVDKDIAPESDTAVISLLGYDPYKNYPGRGPVEAIGAKLKLEEGDIALRCNFGTIVEGKLTDRRAGRSLTTEEASELAEALNQEIKLSKQFLFKNTIGHRGVLIIKGGDLSANITNTDPAYRKEGAIAIAKENFGEKVLQSRPLDKKRSSKDTADLINEFVKQSYTVLKEHPVNLKRKEKYLPQANVILTRDAGTQPQKYWEKKKDWAIFATMPLEKGIAKLAGINNLVYEPVKVTGSDTYNNLHKFLLKEIKEIKKHLKRKFFETYYIHIKETDLPGHDNKPIEKLKLIEIIDKKLFSFIKKLAKKGELKLIITADHSTPCSLKAHSSDPVPVLLYGEGSDNLERFTEEESKKGSLGELKGQELLKQLNFE